MSILHKCTCDECGHVVNGPHSNIPGPDAGRRAESLRRDGWQVRSRFVGCMWHGEWQAFPPGDDLPAWHTAVTLEGLLHAMDTEPADTWDDVRGYFAEIETERRARPAPEPMPVPPPVYRPVQLSLFAS
jgi:hypothetical protein